jgi:hypothetical protein
VKPVPGPVVVFCTRFAANSRSVAFVVVTDPLLLLELFPLLAAVTSTGLAGSVPLYSRTRISGEAAALENVIVTVLAPAWAAAISFA